MPIRAVVFDFGNVLSAPPDPDARKNMEELLGVSPSVFHQAYWEFREAYDRGALNAGPYWQAVANRLARPLTGPLLSDLMAADNRHWTRPNRPMIDWARSVQAAGFKVGLLSNIGDAMEAGVLESCAWLHTFDHLTFSHRLGIAKPDAAIYLHAASGLGLATSEILFVDDRVENVAAAEQVGMTGIQYTDHSLFVAAVDDLPTQTLLPPVPLNG